MGVNRKATMWKRAALGLVVLSTAVNMAMGYACTRYEAKAAEAIRAAQEAKAETAHVETLYTCADFDHRQAVARIGELEAALEEAENANIEQALLGRSQRLDDVTVTYYCACERCCGKAQSDPGYGITASGRRATAGVSIAVDPALIPLGSTVMADYGDGEIHYYRADDTGSAIKGKHIDIYMDDHQEALEAGVTTATVWWCEEGEA